MVDTDLLTQLRQLLAKRFSDGELHTLCFDLGVEYEDLPGAGKADKARELVDYMDRYERLADLLRVGRGARPDVPWPELYATPAVRPSPPADSPALRAIKRQALEQRLADLTAEYEAANDQLGSSLAAVDRLRIQRQLEALEAEIGAVDVELRTLG
jgi:hypothetical protein